MEIEVATEWASFVGRSGPENEWPLARTDIRSLIDAATRTASSSAGPEYPVPASTTPQ